ncbi:MAG TPA: SOS response-associated peptidase [Verrucomicrobiae bacterium]|jgi:putative SOS response-associated peptidase YedK|nr:SOS response-associated peptidase [Verrucomicrobiae bacterium]
MCGRYSVGDRGEITIAGIYHDFTFETRYNAAPKNSLPVILFENNAVTSKPMQWGWERPNKPLLINARAETALKFFRKPCLETRCLIPANGFYEWKDKLPWRFVMRDDETFYLAGIYQKIISPAHAEMEMDLTDSPPASCVIEQFCIITCNANPLVARVHDRMPVILSPSHYSTWLKGQQFSSITPGQWPRGFGNIAPTTDLVDILQSALVPSPAANMHSYRVGQLVNHWKNDSPDCWKPV